LLALLQLHRVHVYLDARFLFQRGADRREGVAKLGAERECVPFPVARERDCLSVLSRVLPRVAARIAGADAQKCGRSLNAGAQVAGEGVRLAFFDGNPASVGSQWPQFAMQNGLIVIEAKNRRIGFAQRDAQERLTVRGRTRLDATVQAGQVAPADGLAQ
jgi:hypothetical protein